MLRNGLQSILPGIVLPVRQGGNSAKRLFFILVAGLLSACGGADEQAQTDAAMAMLTAVGADSQAYQHAVGSREFIFPQDHGQHQGYRSEWWYVTGNLQSGARRFGYQLTFFRLLTQARISHHPSTATAPGHDLAGFCSGGVLDIVSAMPARSLVAKVSHDAPLNRLVTNAGEKCGHAAAIDSADFAWQTAAVWLAQAALSDIDNQRFYTSERFSRELPGLAGAAAERLQVEVADWSLSAPASDPLAVGSMQLSVSSDDFSLQLQLDALKPVVLQGDQGLSVKNAHAADANASWYYSITRLHSSGDISIKNHKFAVTGNSWLDREWSTSALSVRQSGWDWFALQLDNGHDLMFYRLRLADGGIDMASAGVLVDPRGRVTRLSADAISATPLADWHSEQTGKHYPVIWQLQSDAKDIDLTLTAVLPHQEWSGRLQYWEGAVAVHGQWRGAAVKGQGYVELTGYD